MGARNGWTGPNFSADGEEVWVEVGEREVATLGSIEFDATLALLCAPGGDDMTEGQARARPPEIEVDLRGGLVEAVRVSGRLAAHEGVEYRVLDYDVEGCDDEDVERNAEGRAHVAHTSDAERGSRSTRA